MKLDYNDPRYPFIKRATEQFVQREFDKIPTVLFASHRDDDDHPLLTLISSHSRVCPNCNEEVEKDEILLDCGEETDTHDWHCSSCGANYEDEEVTYEQLQYKEAVHAWPGAHGVVFWTTYERAAEVAGSCGFHVYEPSDFNGYILAIDGGGYDFYDAHWIPLYLKLGFAWHENEKGWDEAVIKATVKLRPMK